MLRYNFTLSQIGEYDMEVGSNGSRVDGYDFKWAKFASADRGFEV